MQAAKLTVAAILLLAVTPVVRANLVINEVNNANELQYVGDASNADLLHGLPVTAAGWKTTNGSTTAELNDGIHGDTFAAEGNTVAGTWSNEGATAAYSLGLGSGGFGYDITSAQSIAAWVNAGFGNQAFSFEVMRQDAASFEPIAMVLYTPFAAAAGGASKINITDSTGVLATNIVAVRFTANSTIGKSTQNDFVVREFDVFGSASSAAAAVLDSIAVVNPSFEDTSIPAANGIFHLTTNVLTDGWTEVTGTAGYQRYKNGEAPAAPDGPQHAFANGPGASGPSALVQDTGEVIAAGTAYTLTVDVGQLSQFSLSTGTIRLFGSDAGWTVPLAELAGIAPAPGTYLFNETLEFTATIAQATGQTLGIALIGASGTQVLFDRVRLFQSSAAVPAPAALPAGLAMLGLIASRRRRRA